jgi:transglutaminase-like putative cysteine protease
MLLFTLMLYLATHVTRYLYEEPVSQCLSEARLKPRTLPNQRLIESRIDVEPRPAVSEHHKDYFGNDVYTSTVLGAHTLFITTATSVVEVLATPGALPTITWEQTRDLLAAHPTPGSLEAYEFIFDSPFVKTAPEWAEYASPTFTPNRALAEAVIDLCRRIHQEFTYAPKSTHIEMPLLDVLKQRRGVCQDFAHVMIAVLRSLRLAARYVSGYLRSGANYQGAEASHAWVSVFIPEFGWLNIDPTNDVIPSDGHVTLAWGRDYGDVTPVKGIALGGGGQTVQVEVRVEKIAHR